jgi:hypothetical protein
MSAQMMPGHIAWAPVTPPGSRHLRLRAGLLHRARAIPGARRQPLRVALGANLADSSARWSNQLEVRRGHEYAGVATRESVEKWLDVKPRR